MTIKKYILLSISTLMLAGCTSEDINNELAEERLPLRLEATLSGDRPVTRAYDNKFETDDVLLSYVQHVYKNGDEYSNVEDIQASLVEFSSDMMPKEALYWDNFSNSSKAETYLRTEGHGLRSYYGYCYNGGTPSTALVESTGVLGWSTAEDQSSAELFKKNDLLWSPTQAHVTYNHAKDNHGTITVPYTHAMSEFTIEIHAEEGFSAGDLANTIVTLKDMSKDGTFTAPSGDVSATATTDVTMCPDGNKSELTRTFKAVTVPGTTLTAGNVLAEITDAGGNNYKIMVTDAMLEAANWAKDDGLKDGVTHSAFNYQLTVTINKQKVSVSASLADWNPVSASGVGEINFSTDVTSSGLGTSLNSGDIFTLWRAVKGTEELKEADFIESTTVTSDGTNLTSSPVLYWRDAATSYYFRALATMSGTTLSAVTDKKVSQGTDLLWGTTAKSGGYEENAAIAPRTTDVPLTFKHAMSNVVITLSTETDENHPAWVDLSKATFKLTNLATSGTIAIGDCKIAPVATETVAFSDGESGKARIMVPQTIGDQARLIINLHDGADDASSTTYSLALNGVSSITEWESGNQYNYSIKITKAEMLFSVKIEPWKENKGSGNATLDWD